MKKASKEMIMLVLTIVFILFNLGHIYWPISLIVEDVKLGTMIGNNIGMGAIYCYIIEVFSLPFTLMNGVYIYMNKKIGYVNKVNVIVWFIYIIQIILFNVLLYI